ncbi:MAG: PilZ domain-containing protein [Acidobacteriia bacterium]|nr:PilZ domain-containing protein [Terriglobia bacterium]
MGHRSEQRIVISIPVIVRGVDSRGAPFVVPATTHDISCTGACLQGLNGLPGPGKKVEIECQNEKSWYRVQWIGESRNSTAGRAGVRCLEPGKYIWGVTPKEWEADTYDHATPRAMVAQAAGSPDDLSPELSGQERRLFPRHACRIEAQVSTQDDAIRLLGKITDISLGGCYVEMLSPLPVKTSVKLSFQQDDATLRLTGLVRLSQMSLGMGVAFTGMTPEGFERLRRLTLPAGPSSSAPPAPAQAKATPARPPRPEPRTPPVDPLPDSPPELDPLDPPDVRETLAAVVRILSRKGLLTRAELLEELERLKPVRR